MVVVLNFTKVQLIYSVVKVSPGQHSDSVTQICTFFLMFFSIMAYPRRVNVVLCAIQ